MKDPRGSESQAQRGLLVSLNAYCVPSLATGVENYSNHWGCLNTVKEDTRETKQFQRQKFPAHSEEEQEPSQQGIHTFPPQFHLESGQERSPRV